MLESNLGGAFAAASLVVIRTWYPHVFPGSEAHSLFAWPVFIQVLDLGGAPLLLFFVYFVNFQIVRAFTARRGQGSAVPALALNREAALRYGGSDLVVLPELPVGYHCRAEAGRDIPPLAKETGTAFMLPCTSMIGDKGEAYYNSVIVIDKDGAVGEEYRKLLLVPFGEYIPMERQLPFLRRIFPGVMTFVVGNHGEVIYDFGKGRRLIPSLCYEAIFTGHSRRFVEHGCNVLINMVDDAWFGKSPASTIHMSLALYRAVEYRIPLVRVTNSGVGIFVQPTGEIVPGSRTPLFRKAATAHRLYIPPERSPYTRWGNAFLYGLSGLVVVGLGWCWLTRRNPKVPEAM
ncbi:MAG: apolipoprotein N-acyltransferase [Syntrophales bacterium]